MIPRDRNELERLIKHHKSQIKMLEEEMNFDSTYEVLLRGIIREVGGINFGFVNEKLGNKMDNKKVVNEFDIKVTRSGRTITCRITCIANRKICGIGSATCNKEDRFNFDSGIKLAELRARENLYKNIAKILEEKL